MYFLLTNEQNNYSENMTWKVFLLGAVCCIKIVEVHTIRDSACLGTTSSCGFFSLNCSNGSRIQVDKLEYGSKQKQCMSAYSSMSTYPICKLEEIGCCASKSNDCFEDFNQVDAKSVLDKCSGHSSCGKLQAVRTSLPYARKCSNNFSNYVIVDYSCVSGTLLLNLGADITLTEPEVNVIFHSAANDTVFRNQSTNYTCTIVQTGYTLITLELVDIRIEKPGYARSCSSVKISIPDANFSAECSDANKQQNFVYSRRIVIHLDDEWQTKFSIDNMFSQNSGDYPEMIWIKLEAFPPYTVSVTCRDQKLPGNSGDAANNNTGIIIGVLIPILFLTGVAIVGVFVFRYRYRQSLEKKAVLEFQNRARHDESPMGEHNTEVTKSLSTSICSEIDSHYSNEEECYLEPSQIPEEFAPRVDLSSGGSDNGFDQIPRDKNGTNSKSDTSGSNTSSVRCVNAVEDKSPKRAKDNEIETFKVLAFKSKDISAESKPLSDAEATKTTDKVLKVKRSADDYIEFIHGELYDKPQEPKVVDTNDIGNKQKNLLPSTSTAYGKKSNKDNPVVFVYDYADPDGGTGYLPAEGHFMEDNMYEAVDHDHTGSSDDCNKAHEVFTSDCVDQESSSIKYYNIDSISVGNENVSFDDNYEPIQPPKENCHGVTRNYIPPSPPAPPPPPSSSSSPVSHPSSSLSSNISTRSSSYVNSPRQRATNKPITASKPNATDGYANSPKLWAGKRKPGPPELTANEGDFKDKGNERESNMLQAVSSVSALKLMFESQGNSNSFADNVDSEA